MRVTERQLAPLNERFQSATPLEILRFARDTFGPRTAILTDAVRGGWSAREVGAAVGRLHGNRVPSGGRRPRHPVSKGTARNVAALVPALARVLAFIRQVAASFAALRDRRRPIPSRMRKKLDQLQAEVHLLPPDLASFVAGLDEVLRQDDARRDPPPPFAGG